jgi:hypothetical protein
MIVLLLRLKSAAIARSNAREVLEQKQELIDKLRETRAHLQ